MRDQTSRTYQAEWRAWGTVGSRKANSAVPLRRAQKHVDGFLDGYTVRLHDNECHGFTYVEERLITISDCSPLWILAHEIAHGVVHADGFPDGHHAVFRDRYCSVVAELIGRRPAQVLRETFLDCGLAVGDVRVGWLESVIRRLES